MSYLLDTNLVSEWVRPRPEPRVVAWLADVDEDRVFLSVITLAELRRGVELLSKGERRDHLEQWLAHDLLVRFDARVLDVTQPIAREWGAITVRRQRLGRPIGVMDAFLAATASVHDLTVVTRNDSDFQGAGVETLNPWSDAAGRTDT